MTAPADVVFLLDVDNTLVDNDRVIDDLRNHFDASSGKNFRAGAPLSSNCGAMPRPSIPL